MFNNGPLWFWAVGLPTFGVQIMVFWSEKGGRLHIDIRSEKRDAGT